MTEITPIARAYAPVLRILTRQDPTLTTLADVARAAGKVPSNLRRDWPKLVAAALVEPLPALMIAAEGQALLAALAEEAGARLDGANGVRGESAGEGPEGYAGVLHALIVPDLLNPRKDFGDRADQAAGVEADPDDDDDDNDDDGDDEGDIDSLADSIAAQGVLQNLVVRPLAPMDGYAQPMHRLVAGERRWRAIGRLIKRGDWPADRPVPCRIVDMDDAEHALVALLENLQRKKLKPLEEARQFRRLIDDFGLKTAQIAERIQFKQRVVQQRLQLLTMNEADQDRLDAGEISIEQARRIAAQPKPEPIVLSEAELWTMAELTHKWKHAPKRKNSYYHETECAHGAQKDPVLKRLIELRWVTVSTETYSSEKTYVSRSYYWPDKQDLPAVPEGTAIYRASWLNGPFVIPAEGRARLEKNKVIKADLREAAKREKEKARKLAESVAALTAKPLPLAAGEAEAFGELMKAAGSGWPWTVAEDASVKVDGRSYGVGVNLYGTNPSLVRLLAFAVNAAGADQTQGRPPTVSCSHLFGICLNDVLILKALFETAGEAVIAGLPEASGASAEEVRALQAKLDGKTIDAPASSPARRELAGAA